MSSKSVGHRQDPPRAHVAVDEKLWQECQAVIPKAKPTKLPAYLGKVDGCTVWMVNGNRIAVEHDADFVSAGNGLEDSKLCGRNEIVLDNRTELWDLAADCLHEAVERRHMLAGDSYDVAHKKANVMEMEVRKRWLGRKVPENTSASSTGNVGAVPAQTPQ